MQSNAREVMHLKLISCQVFTREIDQVLTRSPHSVTTEILTMGLHDLGSSMRPHLQERIDSADAEGYDAILLGYALCGRGTEGLRAGKTQVVLPRAHDCMGLLMGNRHHYQGYFDAHPGTYFRSPGWIEYPNPDQALEPVDAFGSRTIGERRSLDDLIVQYGEENGQYLFEEFRSFRRHYSRLTYISTGVESDNPCRDEARAEAEKEGWAFDEVKGSLALLQRMVDGDWDQADFLVVPPGCTVRGSLGDSIVEAV